MPDNVLKVEKLRKGVVIDHIPAGRGFTIAKYLGLFGERKDSLIIATNLVSRKYGKKDIIKIENKLLDDIDLYTVGIFAPNATISYINDFSVIKKVKPQLPQIITGIFSCQNQACITKIEGRPKFYIENKNPVRLRCYYCENIIDEETLVNIYYEDRD